MYNRFGIFIKEFSLHRGDHIVPNFEEIWPSKKNEDKTDGGMTKGMKHVISAMSEGLPGNRDAVFTTVGKPKVRKFSRRDVE